MDKRGIHGPKARRNSILSYLLSHGNSTVEQLAELLSVSRMTVYRDVAELESLQLVQRRNGRSAPQRPHCQNPQPTCANSRTGPKSSAWPEQ